jgi:beta-xylosidase
VYEGIRGPDSLDAGRDNQFALGMARAVQIDGPWEKYPGNPILGDVADNWGVGHADLLIVDGQAILYTATPDLERGRYILAWKK